MKKMMIMLLGSVFALKGMSLEEAVTTFTTHCGLIMQQIIQEQPSVIGKYDAIRTYLQSEKILVEGTKYLSWVMQATIDEDEDLVRVLLVLGADPNIKNIHNETPLYIAASNGSEAIVRMLLENGASINEDGKNEKFHQVTNPLIGAVFCGQAHIVKLLLQENANPDVKDYSGRTILEIAQEEVSQSTDRYIYYLNDDHEEYIATMFDKAQETLQVIKDYYHIMDTDVDSDTQSNEI